MKFENIKAISFDVDGTLWDFDTAMRRSLAATLMELQRVDPIAAQGLSVNAMISIRERVHHRIASSGVDLLTIRLESFKEALRDAGVHCVWLNRTLVRTPRGSTAPDLQIASLSQLGAFL